MQHIGITHSQVQAHLLLRNLFQEQKFLLLLEQVVVVVQHLLQEHLVAEVLVDSKYLQIKPSAQRKQ
jgi:hypothetical protein